MTGNLRSLAEEYAICKVRGHQPLSITLTSSPPMSVCKWCGTRYRFADPELQELGRPADAR